jgi:hypothetical protein
MIGSTFISNSIDISNTMFDINWYLVLATSDISNTQYSINLLTITKTVITPPASIIFKVLWFSCNNGLNISSNGNSYSSNINYSIQDIISNNSKSKNNCWASVLKPVGMKYMASSYNSR